MGRKTLPLFSNQKEDSLQPDVEVSLLPITNNLKQPGYDVAIQVCLENAIVREIVCILKHDKINVIAIIYTDACLRVAFLLCRYCREDHTAGGYFRFADSANEMIQFQTL